MYKLSGYETETIITYNNEDKEANIYTCNKSMIKRLDEAVSKYEAFTLKQEDQYSKSYNVPKKHIRISYPNNLTDEQRQAKSERMKQYKEKQAV